MFGPRLETTNIGILKGGCDTCYLVKRGLCPQGVPPEKLDCTICPHAINDRMALTKLIDKVPKSFVNHAAYTTYNPQLVLEAFIPTSSGGKSVRISWSRGAVTGRVQDVPA